MPTTPEGSPAARVVGLAARAGLTIGTAESLTGGLVSAAIVSVPGASRVHRGAVVAYAAEVKSSVLGVHPDLIARVGTVDEQVAREMAVGARRVLGCDLAVATTGVAGPGPSEGHPAGTVWLACVGPTGTLTRGLRLDGNREGVRDRCTAEALALMTRALTQSP